MNAKTEKIKRVLALWILVFSAIFITLNMNACGDKKNEGGGPGGVQGPVSLCPTCIPGGVGSNLGSALGQNPEIVVGLSFSTGGQSPTQNGSYNGTVAATGFLQIVRPFLCTTQIQITPGPPMAATTVQPGQWAGIWGSSIVRGLTMQANGIQFVIGIGDHYPYVDGIVNGVSPYRSGPNGEQYPSYLAGDVYIQSVNGQPCIGIIESVN